MQDMSDEGRMLQARSQEEDLPCNHKVKGTPEAAGIREDGGVQVPAAEALHDRGQERRAQECLRVRQSNVVRTRLYGNARRYGHFCLKSEENHKINVDKPHGKHTFGKMTPRKPF